MTVLGPVTVKRAYYYAREYRNGVLSERPCPRHRGDILQFRGAPDDELRWGPTGHLVSVMKNLYELADIRVSAKEVERISQMVGDQAEAFHAAEAKASLSDKVVPIKPVPRMYVCMDGTRGACGEERDRGQTG